MELGGRASKLGNTYERLYAIKMALHVMAGRLRSLIWEPRGDNENAIDVQVTDSDSQRINCQLKRQNQSKEIWSVAELRREGILQYARDLLERDPSATYRFVSSCGVRFLRDISEQSHRADDPVASVISSARAKIARQPFNK